MARPRKNVNPATDNSDKKPRQKRVDPTPYKCYYKHFVSQLSLGAILNGKDVISVFMADNATHNYSDVTEIDALKAASKKMFKARSEQSNMVASFRSGSDAKAFMDSYMNTRSQDTITETPLAIETISA